MHECSKVGITGSFPVLSILLILDECSFSSLPPPPVSQDAHITFALSPFLQYNNVTLFPALPDTHYSRSCEESFVSKVWTWANWRCNSFWWGRSHFRWHQRDPCDFLSKAQFAIYAIKYLWAHDKRKLISPLRTSFKTHKLKRQLLHILKNWPTSC